MNRRNYIITLAIGCLLVLLVSGAVFSARKDEGRRSFNINRR